MHACRQAGGPVGSTQCTRMHGRGLTHDPICHQHAVCCRPHAMCVEREFAGTSADRQAEQQCCTRGQSPTSSTAWLDEAPAANARAATCSPALHAVDQCNTTYLKVQTSVMRELLLSPTAGLTSHHKQRAHRTRPGAWSYISAATHRHTSAQHQVENTKGCWPLRDGQHPRQHTT